MKLKTLTAIALACALCAACKKKQPENVPVPKAGGEAVAVSTAPAGEQPERTAFGDYMRGQQAKIEKAKEAKAAIEKAQVQHMPGAGTVEGEGN